MRIPSGVVVGLGFAYGCLLVLVGAMMGFWGEGPWLPVAVIGSPLTFFPPFFVAVPLEWAVLTWLLLKGYRRTAAVWLSMKVLALPSVMRINLKTDSVENDWGLWLGLMGRDFIDAVLLCGIVAAGYLAAWAFVLFPHRLRRNS